MLAESMMVSLLIIFLGIYIYIFIHSRGSAFFNVKTECIWIWHFKEQRATKYSFSRVEFKFASSGFLLQCLLSELHLTRTISDIWTGVTFSGSICYACVVGERCCTTHIRYVLKSIVKSLRCTLRRIKIPADSFIIYKISVITKICII